MGNTTIEAQNYCIYFNEEGTRFINHLIAERRPSKLFLLVDSHTNEHCLPAFLPDLATDIPLEIIEIEAGEPNRFIDTWNPVFYARSVLVADIK